VSATDRWLGHVTAILLAGYFALALYAGFSPSSDPQRGMAQGFIILVALVLLALAAVLYTAMARSRRWIVRTLFALTVLPALSLVAQRIHGLVHRAP
jgi:hypothetical protein